MARCENCIHENVCLHKANIQTDTYAYMGVNYNTEKCEHYKPTADVVPKSEVENLKVLLEMKDVAYEGLKELYDTDTTALIEARQKTEVEVAREIFAEIDKVITPKNHPIAFDRLKVEFAELKKRYQGGELNG